MKDESKKVSEPEQDDSLCEYCANKEECSGHHMMCIDFQPRDRKENKQIQEQ